MLMIYILIMVILIFLLSTYYLYNGDYMAPPFLLCAFFTLSVFSTLMMRGVWDITITKNTTFYILLGIFSFLVGYFILEATIHTKINAYEKLKYINISNKKIIMFDVVSIIVLALFAYYMQNLMGGSTWVNTMAKYRYIVAYGNLIEENINIPQIIIDLKFIINSLIYLFVYILINNFLITKKWNINLIIAISIGLLSTLMGASRLDLIRLPFAAVTIYYFLKFRTGTLSHKRRLRMLSRYLGIAIIVVLLFSFLRSFVGRQNEAGLIEYISHYLGTGTLNFNDYLRNPVDKSPLFGKETFWGIYNFLGKLTHIPEYNYDYTLEFRSIAGYGMGNVYTAFRMFYADFGGIGVSLLSIIQGGVFAVFYRSIKCNKKVRFFKTHVFKPSLVEFRIIIYAMIVHSVALMFYADWFYSQVLSWTQIKAFIYLYIFKILLIDTDKLNKQTLRNEVC